MQAQYATVMAQPTPGDSRETLIRVEQQSVEQLGVLGHMLEEISSRLSGPGPTDDQKAAQLGAPIPTGAISLAHDIRTKVFRLSERAQEILNEI